ncbi:DUF6907 domain-containing protein [Streptomyces wuyuanensis]|uniref:DUF6907 domain-containing protein n=1 Tax=Streptomyces wuyuanensis TaxID=1196353 RepID=UPI00342A2E8E
MSTTVPMPSIPPISTRPTGRLPHLIAALSSYSTAFSIGPQHSGHGDDSHTDGQPVTTACPDGIPWCLGRAEDHADPDEHIHHGPETAITTAAGDKVMTFALVQWHDKAPRLEHEGRGDWDHLDLAQVDTLRADTVAYLARLDAAREQLAQLLNDQDGAAR